MSIEVTVFINNGKSKLFLLQEDSTLQNLREKITERLSADIGSDFYFLKGKAEIDPGDEDQYKLSQFKTDNGISVTLVSEKNEEKEKAQKDNPQKKEAAKKAKDSAKTDLDAQTLLTEKLKPENKPEWGEDPTDRSLINDKESGKTDAGGFYLQVNWEKLHPLLKSFKFPKALKFTSEGLEPVLYPGIKLSRDISPEDVVNEVQLVTQSEAYYTAWEKEAYKMGCKNISSSVGIPVSVLSAALGLSAQYKTSSETLTQSKKNRLYMIANRLVQKTKVILNKQSIQLTDEFKEKIERAVHSQNIGQLRQVFQEYGYFVPTAYIIGGKILAEETKTFDGDIDQTAAATEFGVAVSAELDKAGFTASVSSAYKSGSTEQGKASSFQSTRNFQLTLKGGDEGLLNDGAAWIRSLTFDKWQIIGYEGLQPITDFLDEELKKQCEAMLVNYTVVSCYSPQRDSLEITNDAWDEESYFGTLKEIYADTNPVFVPKGKKLVGISFRQKGGNRLAPSILVQALNGNNQEWLKQEEWNDRYFGSLAEIYVDTHPVFIPAGKILSGFAFRQYNNRLAPKILVANMDGSDEQWVENNDWGHHYFGPLKEIYADTNSVFVPDGKSLVGFALRKKGGNRIAPVLLVQ
jgi:hypothetical protein